MFTSKLTTFIAAARSCSEEMVANAGYIEKELPSVGFSEERENAVKKVCSALVETRLDVVSELAELSDPAVSSRPAEVQDRVDTVVRWLGQELPDLHALVTSLQSASATEPELGLGCVLVAESAANILRSFLEASEAADCLREAIRGDGAIEGKAPGAARERVGPLVSHDLADAFAYALALHSTQVRKQAKDDEKADGIPYMSHLMMVSALVLEHGGSETEAIAALLHDGPEDQGGEATLEEIQQRFGSEVAEIVKVCTDTFEDPKPDWWPRKRKYHDALRQGSNSAILVSLADKTHNLEATRLDVEQLGEEFWDRFTQGRLGSLWYYASLLEIYRETVTDEAMPRAVRLVDRLEAALDGLCDQDEKQAALEYGREKVGRAT